MKKPPISKKTISVRLRYYGNGYLVEHKPGHFLGGVVEPKIDGNIDFNMRREVLDLEEGILNPTLDEGTVEGAFQINIWGSSAGFRELGEYLLAIAELDIGNDPSFHEHHEIKSGDERTKLHLIIRREAPVIKS